MTWLFWLLLLVPIVAGLAVQRRVRAGFARYRAVRNRAGLSGAELARDLLGMHLHAGELAAAASLVEEVEAFAEATAGRFAAYESLALAVWRGRG